MDREHDPARRLWNLLTIGCAQTKILREPIAGAMHATIFWGFMVLAAGTVEHALVERHGGSFSAEHGLGPANVAWWTAHEQPAARATSCNCSSRGK